MIRRILFVAVPVALLTLLILVSRRTPQVRAATASAAFATTVATQQEAVDRVVATRNHDNGKDESAFLAAGWQMSSSAPPDLRLVELDPTLIQIGRESELRTQLASSVPQARLAHRMADIAILAHEPATRESAVDALSRLHTPDAEEELARLLTSGKLAPDDPGRRQLAALLQPTDLDDSTAARMAGLLDDEHLTAVERKQLAFTLALVGLRDGMTLPSGVVDAMSPNSMALIDAMSSLAKKSLIAHAHEGEP